METRTSMEIGVWLGSDAKFEIAEGGNSHHLYIEHNDTTIDLMCWKQDKSGFAALRDALDEILVGVPVPPEDEVVGLTDGEPFDDGGPYNEPKCINHPERLSVIVLDQEQLCEECAEAWVRAEDDAHNEDRWGVPPGTPESSEEIF